MSTPNLKSPGYHPPIAPKPDYVSKSPHEPSPPRDSQSAFQRGHQKSKHHRDISALSLNDPAVAQDTNHQLAGQIIDDLDGIDGGICANELEAHLLRELIYAFQGIEGLVIKRKSATSIRRLPESADALAVISPEGIE